MSVARDLLDRLAEIGATVRPAGEDRLIVHAGAKPVPAELVHRLRQAKAEVLAALAQPPDACNAAWWRDFFEERAAHLEIDAGYPRIEAETLAFNGCIAEWHLRHGALPEPGNCAACGGELDPQFGLFLDRGVRVHFGGAYEIGCVVAYDRRCRDAAIAALRMLGVAPPKGFEP
jgi:hypothetical protein